MRVETREARWSPYDSGIGSMATLCLNLSHDGFPSLRKCPVAAKVGNLHQVAYWSRGLNMKSPQGQIGFIFRLEVRGRTGEPRPWEFTETLMQPKLRQRSTRGQ